MDATDTLSIIKSLEMAKEICYDTGQEYACIKYSKRLCEVKKEYYGSNSKEYLLELLELSELFSERLRMHKSYEVHNSAYEPYMHKLREDFESLGLDERQVYWLEASKYIRKTLDIAYRTASRYRVSDSSLMAESAYNATLLYKGLLLNLSNTADTEAIPNLKISWKDVRNKLGSEDLAIEFFRTDEGKYGALLLKNKWKSPKLIRLPELKDKSSDDALAEVSKCMSTINFVSGNTLNSASRIVWSDRLLQYFPKNRKGKVYFSSDGMLLQTGIEYLPFDTSSNVEDYYTVSDVYDIVRLSSTRELVLENKQEKLDTAALFGGIYYRDVTESLTSVTQRSAAQMDIPATYTEVLDIQDKFVSNGIKVRLRTESEADALSFTEMSDGRYGVIHIATHGMYWSKDQKPEVIDPLERCGLLFSDEMVTAGVISRLNLEHSNLVVLSACETALGDISQDGVLGLQRGFKMAGAGTILMSLWKVSDDVTKELMGCYYSNLLTPGQTARSAFNQAVNTIRAKYPTPYYWAAFIMLD